MLLGAEKKIFNILLTLTISSLFLIFYSMPMQMPQLEAQIRNLAILIQDAQDSSVECVLRGNESIALAHNANQTAIQARNQTREVEQQLNEALASIITLRNDLAATQQTALALHDQIQGFNDIVTQATQHIGEEIRNEAQRHYHNLDLEQRNQLIREKIQQKQTLGIFEQQERMRAQAVVNATITKWDKIREMINAPGFMAKVICTLFATAIGFYIAKHAIPAIIEHFSKPSVISETSKCSWFYTQSNEEETNLYASYKCGR